MTDEETRILGEAMDWARRHKGARCRELTDPSKYLPEAEPVSVFMAGSPGAGKTESAMELVAEFEKRDGSKVLRIDPDELRCEFPGYNGHNSWLFQQPVSSWVDRMLDLAIKNSQSFILDGTFSDLPRARSNVLRALKHKRKVQILYVYQDPMLAWEFVLAREADEGRRILPEKFIEQYFAAREVVNTLKAELGGKISVDLLLKPNNSAEKMYQAGIDQIDYHVPEKYDRAMLARLLEKR